MRVERYADALPLIETALSQSSTWLTKDDPRSPLEPMVRGYRYIPEPLVRG
jgi:hypothetical protein